mgnify:CR=1 FL=1
MRENEKTPRSFIKLLHNKTPPPRCTEHPNMPRSKRGTALYMESPTQREMVPARPWHALRSRVVSPICHSHKHSTIGNTTPNTRTTGATQKRYSLSFIPFSARVYVNTHRLQMLEMRGRLDEAFRLTPEDAFLEADRAVFSRWTAAHAARELRFDEDEEEVTEAVVEEEESEEDEIEEPDVVEVDEAVEEGEEEEEGKKPRHSPPQGLPEAEAGHDLGPKEVRPGEDEPRGPEGQGEGGVGKAEVGLVELRRGRQVGVEDAEDAPQSQGVKPRPPVPKDEEGPFPQGSEAQGTAGLLGEGLPEAPAPKEGEEAEEGGQGVGGPGAQGEEGHEVRRAHGEGQKKPGEEEGQGGKASQPGPRPQGIPPGEVQAQEEEAEAEEEAVRPLAPLEDLEGQGQAQDHYRDPARESRGVRCAVSVGIHIRDNNGNAALHRRKARETRRPFRGTRRAPE